MTALNWLHLSDWHQRGNEFDRQVVLKALLKDIREREKINPRLHKIDFVIFSGDIAFNGKTEEYQTATEQFFKPLLDVCGLTAKQLFIVPGNHDLNRDEFEFLPHELTEPLTSEAKVQHWLTDDRRRSHLLGPFRAFSSFVKDYTGQEKADYVHVRKMQIDDIEVALIGLNSAWMCGRNKAQIGDKGFVIVGEPQIHSVLDEISDADLKIAVLHHPFDWLTEFDCNRIETRLLQGCDFILRGHQHKPKVEVTNGTSGNCVIIPAGASYDRRMAENPAYANSYNLVHLDFNTGKGTAFLRGWSDPRNKWVEDINSCDRGECDFVLSRSASNAISINGHWKDNADNDEVFFVQKENIVVGIYDLGKKHKVGYYIGRIDGRKYEYKWHWYSGKHKGHGIMHLVDESPPILSGRYWDEDNDTGDVIYEYTNDQIPAWLSRNDFIPLWKIAEKMEL